MKFPTRKPRRWQLQDAKNRLSELVTNAQQDGPQIVTRRGAEAAVVLSYTDYQKLSRAKHSRSFVDVLLAAPKVAGGLHVERSRDPGRKIDLK
jgi:prevent-host-death family protein